VSDRQARIDALLRQPAPAAVLSALNGDGEETRIVGGAVRSLLLGEAASDIDLATTALPNETMRRGAAAGFKPVPTGVDYGTVTLVGHGASFEVTTLRCDIETDGRHAKVVFGRDFAQDALRRDFTINALGLDRDGNLHDFCGGLDDLAARKIRFIGDASARIAEDYLRILRFFRFHARYGQGAPDAEGFAACIAGRAGLEFLSRERVRAEMLKLVVAPGAADAVAAMAGGGLLMPVLGCVPRLARFAAIAGRKEAGKLNPAFRLAALAVEVREDTVLLRERLRLSNEEFDRIWRLARAQEALAGRNTSPDLAALRHLAHEVGADAVAGALVLLTASSGPDSGNRTGALIAELEQTPPFLLTGRDVMALGVAPGPQVGRVLQQARHDWADAGCPAEKATQLAFVSIVAMNILES
jgi:poly(A) polymerase